MDEQNSVRDLLNDFLKRRGLRANFLAQQLKISESVLYSYKTGGRFLTQRQLQKLRDFIQDYDRKLDGTNKEMSENGNETEF